MRYNRPMSSTPAHTIITPPVLSAHTLGETDLDTHLSDSLELNTPWQVIVWNDPVNLMTYVS